MRFRALAVIPAATHPLPPRSGPGGGYFVLAGRDASRALAKMDLAPASVQSPVKLDDLIDGERKTLDSWFDRLSAKYPCVGEFVEGGARAKL